MGKVYIRKRNKINESAGADPEITEISTKISNKLNKDFSDYAAKVKNNEDKIKEYKKEFIVELHINKNNQTDEFKYKVKITAGFFDDMENSIGDCCDDFYRLYLKGNYPYAFEIRLNLTYAQPINYASTLAHELLHTKTGIREEDIKNKQTGNSLSKLFSIYITDKEPTRFDVIKYFFSPNEMKSFTQELYSETKSATENFLNNKHKIPTNNDFKEMLLETHVWNFFKKIKRVVNTINTTNSFIDDNDIKNFLETLRNKQEFKKVTGISSVDDFKKYIIKMCDKMENKLRRSSFLGYQKGVEEYSL